MASCTAFSETLTSAGILGNAGARVTATAESAESECLEISAAVSGSAGAAGAGAAGSGSAGTGTGGSVLSWRPGRPNWRCITNTLQTQNTEDEKPK